MSTGLYMKYFVLKPKGKTLHARASRRAIRQYAKLIAQENEAFARELTEWADNEFALAIADGMADGLERE